MMMKTIKWSSFLIALSASTPALAAPECPSGTTWDADIGICAGPKIDPAVRSGMNLIFESAGIVGVVTQGSGGGCWAGYTFMGQWGGCVKQSQQSESQSQSCGTGYTGTQTRVRYRTVYSHQNGGVQYGAWGAWGAWSGACAAIPPPPTPTPTIVTVTALICSSSDAGYSSGPMNSYVKDQIIVAYKEHFNNMKRCPEEQGFVWWQNRIADGTYTVPEALNGIRTSLSPYAVKVANEACHDAANAIIGAGKFQSSTYRFGSGNKCDVTY